MSHDSLMQEQTLETAFPSVDPGVLPLGARVLVQLKTISKKTKSGLIMVEETRDTEKYNTQVGKIIYLGELAFRNRETGAPWPEGVWACSGEFVRVPRWGGDRWSVPVPGSDEPANFVIFNDHEMIGKVTGDPLTMNTYIL